MELESFPIEILHHILYLATNVPDAGDTSFEVTERVDPATTLDQIRDSLLLKSSLSRVSWKFHSILETLLYEFIVIREFKNIPSLLDSLRLTPFGHCRPRGHTCHRLDIYLGVAQSPSEYNDEAWHEGGHTLWGLIPACPRLEVLVVRIACFQFGEPHLTHNALWKTLASCLAGTLRRLDLYGVAIRMDRVEMMLRYMTHLEVCRIYHCKPFSDLDIWSLEADGVGFEPDTYDDEESTERPLDLWISCHGVDINIGSSQIRAPDTMTSSGFFKKSIRSEFEHALKADWPPFTGASSSNLAEHGPYTLPRLHTFTLNTFTRRFFQFCLPVLRSLRIGRAEQFRLLHIYTTDTLFPDDNPPPSVQKFYSKPEPHSTLFGMFPPTITHLHIRRDAPLANILYFFPNLTHLTWDIYHRPIPRRPFLVPHATLKHVTIYQKERSKPLVDAVEEMLDAVRQKYLDSLEEIVCRVWSQDPDRIVLPIMPYEESEDLGVNLSVVISEHPYPDTYSSF